MLTAVVCSGRNRPAPSNGGPDHPYDRRSSSPERLTRDRRHHPRTAGRASIRLPAEPGIGSLWVTCLGPAPVSTVPPYLGGSRAAARCLFGRP